MDMRVDQARQDQVRPVVDLGQPLGAERGVEFNRKDAAVLDRKQSLAGSSIIRIKVKDAIRRHERQAKLLAKFRDLSVEVRLRTIEYFKKKPIRTKDPAQISGIILRLPGIS